MPQSRNPLSIMVASLLVVLLLGMALMPVAANAALGGSYKYPQPLISAESKFYLLVIFNGLIGFGAIFVASSLPSGREVGRRVDRYLSRQRMIEQGKRV